MFLKFFLLLLIIRFSDEQSDINIGLLGGEKTLDCAQDIGRTQFTTQYSFSEQKTLNSYFLLYFKDSSNKRYTSICSLPSSKPEQNSTELDPSQSGTNPSSNEANSSSDEPNPSQGGKNEPKDIDYEIIRFLGKQENKIKMRIENALSNDGIKNILGNLSNIESYHIISLTEKATSFIEKKLSANLNTSLNALQKIKNFNFTEAKNNFNISLCNIKKKIVENIPKNTDLLTKYNMSKIFQDISKILPEMNITIDREKIVDNLNDSLTKFNSYFIQSLEKK